MNCPKCNNELIQKFYKGLLEVDACPNCRGLWLDAQELDRLEDLAFDEDERKGSLIHFQQPTEFLCPHCASPLVEFQYRLYDLRLEYCAENAHGFWLDGGEEERVLALMQKRAKDMQRQTSAEAEWKQALKGIHSFLKDKRQKK
ncbi:MAG: zf-TFIIB domain-containing protein [Anaerolineales bacterium]|nr:zf-TFIIB domain-containing protein [Anaerolineales bacterium]